MQKEWKYSRKGIVIGIGMVLGFSVASFVPIWLIAPGIIKSTEIDCNTLTMNDMSNYTNKQFTSLSDFKSDCMKTQKEERDNIPIQSASISSIIVGFLVFMINFPILELHKEYR